MHVGRLRVLNVRLALFEERIVEIQVEQWLPLAHAALIEVRVLAHKLAPARCRLQSDGQVLLVVREQL